MVNENTSEKVEKLNIDDPTNFSFHAAFMTYSKAWAENSDKTARLELNKIMTSLAENELSYSSFYREIGQYRKDEAPHHARRARFKAKKKRDWRRSQAKRIRISRHKK